VTLANVWLHAFVRNDISKYANTDYRVLRCVFSRQLCVSCPFFQVPRSLDALSCVPRVASLF